MATNPTGTRLPRRPAGPIPAKHAKLANTMAANANATVAAEARQDDATNAGGGVFHRLIGGDLCPALFVVATDEEDGNRCRHQQDRRHEGHGELRDRHT